MATRPLGMTLGLAVVLAAIAVYLSIVLRGDASHGPNPVAIGESASGNSGTAPGGTLTEPYAPRRQPVARPQLRVVCASDGRAIPGATLAEISRDAPSRTLSDDVVAIADADGCIELPWLLDETRTFVVRSPGFVPGAFTGGPDPGRLALERAARLRIGIIDEFGRPVVGCTVLLTTRAVSVPTGAPEPGIGHPLSDDPLWVSRRDATTDVVFDELPDGLYVVNVWHDSMVQVGGDGNGRVIRVDGDVALTVTMQEMFGVVFECPSRSPVEYSDWNVRTLGLDRSPNVVSRLGAVRDALRRRFPTAHVYVHRPVRPDEDLMVTYWLAAADGTFWRATWPLAPVSSIDAPVYMEQMDVGQLAKLTVRLRDESGTQFDGIPLLLENRALGYNVETATGRETVLPRGEYVLHPRVVTKWLFECFGGLTGLPITVSETSAPVYDLELDGDFTTVEIRPTTTTGELTGVLSLAVEDARGGGRVISNWRPSRGPIAEVLRPGPAHIRVVSAAYEIVETDLTVPSGQDRFVVEIPLIERPPTPR